MPDAVPVNAPADTVVAVDVVAIHIRPLDNIVAYRFQITWQSGRVEMQEFKQVKPEDFGACLNSFCKTAPKNKFLTWLVSAGYETNLTPV
jgi:hypothetical protein